MLQSRVVASGLALLAFSLVGCRADRVLPAPDFIVCCDPPPPPPPNPPVATKFWSVTTGMGFRAAGDNQLHVFLLGDPDSIPYVILRTNTGAWSWKGALPNPVPRIPFFALATGIGNDGDYDENVGGGNLQVLGLGSHDHALYQMGQNRDNGTWQWGGMQVYGARYDYKFFGMADGVHAESETLYMYLIGGIGSCSAGSNICARPTYWSVDYTGQTGIGWPGSYDNGSGVPLGSIAAVEFLGYYPRTSAVVGLGLFDAFPYVVQLEVFCDLECTQGWIWRGALPNPSGLRFKAITADWGYAGHAQVVALGESDGLPYVIWKNNTRDNSQGDTWTWQGRVPGVVPFSKIALHRDVDNNLQLVGLGATDGIPYLISQSYASGIWSWIGALPNPSHLRFKAAAMGWAPHFFYRTSLFLILIGADDGLPYAIWKDATDGTWKWYGRLPTH